MKKQYKYLNNTRQEQRAKQITLQQLLSRDSKEKQYNQQIGLKKKRQNIIPDLNIKSVSKTPQPQDKNVRINNLHKEFEQLKNKIKHVENKNEKILTKLKNYNDDDYQKSVKKSTKDLVNNEIKKFEYDIEESQILQPFNDQINSLKESIKLYKMRLQKKEKIIQQKNILQQQRQLYYKELLNKKQIQMNKLRTSIDKNDYVRLGDYIKTIDYKNEEIQKSLERKIRMLSQKLLTINKSIKLCNRIMKERRKSVATIKQSNKSLKKISTNQANDNQYYALKQKQLKLIIEELERNQQKLKNYNAQLSKQIEQNKLKFEDHKQNQQKQLTQLKNRYNVRLVSMQNKYKQQILNHINENAKLNEEKDQILSQLNQKKEVIIKFKMSSKNLESFELNQTKMQEVILKLQNQVKAKKQQIIGLKDVISTIKNQKANIEFEFERYKSISMNQKKNQLNQQQVNKKKKISLQQMQSQQSYNQLNMLKEQIKKLKSSNQTLNTQNTKMKKQIWQLSIKIKKNAEHSVSLQDFYKKKLKEFSDNSQNNQKQKKNALLQLSKIKKTYQESVYQNQQSFAYLKKLKDALKEQIQNFNNHFPGYQFLLNIFQNYQQYYENQNKKFTAQICNLLPIQIIKFIYTVKQQEVQQINKIGRILGKNELKISQIAQSIKKLKEQCNELNTKIDNKEHQCLQLSEKINQKEQLFNELKNNYEQIRKQKYELQYKYKKQQKQQKEKEKKVEFNKEEEKKEKIKMKSIESELKNTIMNFQLEIKQRDKKLKTIENQNAVLNKKIEQFKINQKNYGQLKQEHLKYLQSSENQIKKIKQENGKLKVQINQIKGKIQNQSLKIEQLQSINLKLNHEKQNLISEKKIQDQIKKLNNNKNQQQQSQILILKNKNLQLQKYSNTLNKKIESLTNQIKNFDNIKKKLTQQINSKHQQQIQLLKKQWQLYFQNEKQQFQKKLKLKKENEDLINLRLEQKINEVNKYFEQNKIYQSKINEMENKVKQKQQQLNNQKQYLQNIKSEAHSNEQKIHMLQQEKQILYQNSLVLQEQYNKKKSKLQNTIKEKQEKLNEMQKLQYQKQQQQINITKVNCKIDELNNINQQHSLTIFKLHQIINNINKEQNNNLQRLKQQDFKIKQQQILLKQLNQRNQDQMQQLKAKELIIKNQKARLIQIEKQIQTKEIHQEKKHKQNEQRIKRRFENQIIQLKIRNQELIQSQNNFNQIILKLKDKCNHLQNQLFEKENHLIHKPIQNNQKNINRIQRISEVLPINTNFNFLNNLQCNFEIQEVEEIKQKKPEQKIQNKNKEVSLKEFFIKTKIEIQKLLNQEEISVEIYQLIPQQIQQEFDQLMQYVRFKMNQKNEQQQLSFIYINNYDQQDYFVDDQLLSQYPEFMNYNKQIKQLLEKLNQQAKIISDLTTQKEIHQKTITQLQQDKEQIQQQNEARFINQLSILKKQLKEFKDKIDSLELLLDSTKKSLFKILEAFGSEPKQIEESLSQALTYYCTVGKLQQKQKALLNSYFGKFKANNKISNNKRSFWFN